jgi:hypothetical protein
VNLQSELQARFQNEGGGIICKIDIDQTGERFIDVGEQAHRVSTEVEMPITIIYDTESYKFKLYGIQNSATNQ